MKASTRASLCASLALCLIATPSKAAEGWRPDGGFVQFGTGNATEAALAGLQWDWGFEWRPIAALRFTGRWEAALGRWRIEQTGGGHSWLTQFTLAPNLRLSGPGETGWYGEFGIGPSWLTPNYESRDRRFSTRLNFQDHLSLGYVWGRGGTHDLALRLDHYSNGGHREPNPGIEIYSLRYVWRFE